MSLFADISKELANAAGEFEQLAFALFNTHIATQGGIQRTPQDRVRDGPQLLLQLALALRHRAGHDFVLMGCVLERQAQQRHAEEAVALHAVCMQRGRRYQLVVFCKSRFPVAKTILEMFIDVLLETRHHDCQRKRVCQQARETFIVTVVAAVVVAAVMVVMVDIIVIVIIIVFVVVVVAFGVAFLVVVAVVAVAAFGMNTALIIPVTLNIVIVIVIIISDTSEIKLSVIRHPSVQLPDAPQCLRAQPRHFPLSLCSTLSICRCCNSTASSSAAAPYPLQEPRYLRKGHLSFKLPDTMQASHVLARVHQAVQVRLPWRINGR